MGNKTNGNENKILLGDFHSTIDKMDRNGRNKTQRIYRCCSNYALSKPIEDNGLEGLQGRENPDLYEFTHIMDPLPQDPG